MCTHESLKGRDYNFFVMRAPDWTLPKTSCFCYIMPTWVVKDYVNPQGRNVIRDWMAKDLTSIDRVRLDERLSEIETKRTDRDDMPPEWVKRYQGTERLYEVKVKG